MPIGVYERKPWFVNNHLKKILTEEKKRKIISDRERMSITRTARRNGVSRATVVKLSKGQGWNSKFRRRKKGIMTPGLVKLDQLEIYTDVQGRQWVSKVAYDDVRGEYDALLPKYNQVRDNGALLDVEKEEIKTARQNYLTIKGEMDELTLYIRKHFAQEIELGLHNQFKNAVEAACLYLGKYISGGKK